MAKITSEQAKSAVIIKATYFEGKWTVVVNDTDNMSYVVFFRGSVDDTDDVILKQTYEELLKMDKQEPIVFDEPVSRDLSGKNPKDIKK